MKKFEIDANKKQINKFDERAYEIRISTGKKNVFDIKILINTTEILGYDFKGDWFYRWLKSNGFNADVITKEASDIGNGTHDLITKTLRNEVVKFEDLLKDYKPNMALSIWEKYLLFCEWFVVVKPKVILTEEIIYNIFDEKEILDDNSGLGYGGTLDAVFEIDKQICMVDFKTGQDVNTVDLQLSAYYKCLEKMGFYKKIDRVFALHLNKGIYKKLGYKEIDIEMKSINYLYNQFLNLYSVWLRHNKRWRPKYLLYPSEVDLKYLNKIKLGKKVIQEKYPDESEINIPDSKKIKTNKNK